MNNEQYCSKCVHFERTALKEGICTNPKAIVTREGVKFSPFATLRHHLFRCTKGYELKDLENCYCGKPAQEKYAPCCSLACWHRRYTDLKA